MAWVKRPNIPDWWFCGSPTCHICYYDDDGMPAEKREQAEWYVWEEWDAYIEDQLRTLNKQVKEKCRREFEKHQRRQRMLQDAQRGKTVLEEILTVDDLLHPVEKVHIQVETVQQWQSRPTR